MNANTETKTHTITMMDHSGDSVLCTYDPSDGTQVAAAEQVFTKQRHNGCFAYYTDPETHESHFMNTFVPNVDIVMHPALAGG